VEEDKEQKYWGVEGGNMVGKSEVGFCLSCRCSNVNCWKGRDTENDSGKVIGAKMERIQAVVKKNDAHTTDAWSADSGGLGGYHGE
jgi:hypothetical protein